MTLMNQSTPNTQTTRKQALDSAQGAPQSLQFVRMDKRHAEMLSDILKRTHRASAVEQDWLLHTIDVIDSQLAQRVA